VLDPTDDAIERLFGLSHRLKGLTFVLWTCGGEPVNCAFNGFTRLFDFEFRELSYEPGEFIFAIIFWT